MSKIFHTYLWGMRLPARETERDRENKKAFVAVRKVFFELFCRCVAVLYVVFA